jgi:ubiquinone biosynthesis accessory factor UbiJ
LFFMDLLQASLSRALNRLLDAESWARERLAPFSGETVALRVPPLPELRLRILEGGRTALAEREAQSSLALTVGPGAFIALPRGADHAMREVEVSGNARLANEILFLARHLRWDVEEELSHALGDVLAHRVVGEARKFAIAAADSGRRVAEAVMDYAVEERRLVVRRDEHQAMADETARLRDAIERLEKRIERLV